LLSWPRSLPAQPVVYETMNMRLIPAFAGLAIAFALPALAQEQNSVDPEVRQQIEAVTKRREEAYNK
jgi:hypothetical protein